MSSAISLKEKGIRVFNCRLYNHDYLWFSSYEISKISSTIPISIIMLLPILLVIILMAFLKVLSLVTKKTWLVYLFMLLLLWQIIGVELALLIMLSTATLYARMMRLVESIHLTWAGEIISTRFIQVGGIMPSKQVSSVTCLLLTAEFQKE